MDILLGLFSGTFLLVFLAIGVITIVAMWQVFAKAGKPGWAAIVPIYNIIVLLEIVGKPLWWLVLFLIPFVSFVALILVYIDLAKCFGKTGGFAAGMIFLPFIFFPMLAFSDARYSGPSAGPLVQTV